MPQSTMHCVSQPILGLSIARRRAVTSRGGASARQPIRAASSREGCRRVARGTDAGQPELNSRRAVLGVAASAAVGNVLKADDAQALGFKKDLKPPRLRKIPDSEFKELPSGIKYYDVKVGDGLVAQQGSRVAIHYDCKWRGITFMTSRQGMGVTGGTPMGFDVGAKGNGGTLEGLDLGVRGMRVGGQRKLKVPPEYGYGDRQIGEIPPGSTLDIDVELLSIKTSPYGSRVKLIEG